MPFGSEPSVGATSSSAPMPPVAGDAPAMKPTASPATSVPRSDFLWSLAVNELASSTSSAWSVFGPA